MITKRLLLLASLLVLGAAVVGCTGVVGNGDVIEETRTLDSFNKISISGAGSVVVEYGESESVRIEAESNVMEYLETEVRGDTLEIGTRNGVDITTTRNFHFYLTVTNLEAVEVSGAADVTLPNVQANDFEIRISGTGNVTIQSLQADSLDVEISGAGNVNLEGGEVQSQDVTISGAGGYNGRELVSQDAQVDLSGAGNITLNVTAELRGSASGAGSVLYAGEPETVDVDVSGAGSVNALD
ncbi:MAG: DUF2807 domain-containing protein [Anaerolineae bacterium]|nr:DUF2807 domain-containing protein [Anaerolineae bacterium]